MQLTSKQLSTQLKKQLPSFILISGDEPLLIEETRDTVLAEAAKKGFCEREIMHIDSAFRIDSLVESTQNQSLFSEKKIIDIRNTSGKFDVTLTTFIKTYLSDAQTDTLLIISSPKLTPAQQKTAWCESIKKDAFFVSVNTITASALPQWIADRTKALNLTVTNELINMIAYFCEGNLLAAHQIIEKLNLLYAGENITKEQLISVLTDNARYSIFDLTNTIAQRNTKKATRIVRRLQQSGEEPILVLWSLTRYMREKNDKPGLQKAAQIDQVIKGASSGDAWQLLLELTITLCGISSPRASA